MKRVFIYCLCLLLSLGALPLGAQVCHESASDTMQMASDSGSELVSSETMKCHDSANANDEADDSQQSKTQDCCDDDCNTCAHASVFIKVSTDSLLALVSHPEDSFFQHSISFITAILLPPPIV